MKLYALIMGYSCFFLYLCAETTPADDELDDMYRFYREPRFEWDGHLWRPIMLQHHPDCPCKCKN